MRRMLTFHANALQLLTPELRMLEPIVQNYCGSSCKPAAG